MADTSISGARVARELDALVRVYGKPACIVSDNGTEFTSRAILKWAGDNDVDWHYIDPPLIETTFRLPGNGTSLSRMASSKASMAVCARLGRLLCNRLPGNGRAVE